MIDSLRIKGFKNFKDVELQLGPWNLFIGANASGKSNLFEVLRVFQGLALGYRVDEIFGGKPKSARGDTWEGIRGGLANAGFFSQDLVSFGISGSTGKVPFSYDITISTAYGRAVRQALTFNGGPVFDGIQPALEGSPPLHPHAFQFVSELRNTMKLDLSPAILRQYSSSKEVRQMGERGENFAALVKTITDDPGSADAYQSWLAQLVPREFDSVTILSGALGEPLFALKHNGKIFPAPVLSDGTLRFAALTAAFFQPDPPNYLVVEEIENGIHPNRLRLLIEIFRQLSSPKGAQVFASTHSPAVLDWLNDEDLKHTFLCSRDEETGASTVRSLASISGFREIIKDHSAGDLFAEGWMETVA